MGPIGGWELVIILIVFLIIVGPQRLPEYTQKIIRSVRQVRRWVDENRTLVEDEMGIAVEDLKKYDPRQYDPRRIIREAWGDTSLDDLVPDSAALASAVGAGAVASSSRASDGSSSAYEVDEEISTRAPFDPDAT